MKFSPLFLNLICGIVAFGQSKKEMNELFKTLNQQPIDRTIYRICEVIDRNQITRDSTTLFMFHKRVKAELAKNGQEGSERFADILILWDQSRWRNYGTKKSDKEFTALYENCMANGEYLAALQTLWYNAENYHFDRNPIESLKKLFACKKLIKQYHLENGILLQRVYHNIGLMFYQAKLYTQAIPYIEKAMATSHNKYRDSLESYNILGICNMKLNRLQAAEIAYSQCQLVALNAKDSGYYAIIVGNIGVVKQQLKKLDEAYALFEYDKINSIKHNVFGSAMNALTAQLSIRIDQHRMNEATILFKEMNEMRSKIWKEDWGALHGIAEAEQHYFEEIGDFQKALLANKKVNQYEVILQKSNKPNEISLWQLKAELNFSESEAKRAEEAKKSRTLLLSIVLIFSLFISLITVLFFYNRVRNIRNRNELIAKENDLLALKNQKQQDDNQHLEDQLKLHISTIKEKNSAIEELEMEKGNSLRKLQEDADNNSRDYSDVEDLLILKNYKISTKENWLQFKTLFNQIFPYFEMNLEKNRELTFSGSEQRLMMLHKLKMETDEIADVLSISHDSVKKSRHRLYKKLNINSMQELNLFLGKLDS
jgi:tetratricopeptide (TPR) repeat protein